MSQQNRIDTDELQQGIDLSEIIGRHVSLKKKGAEHVGNCPFHDEDTGSLSVNDRKGLWKCFGCGAGGNDGISFLMRKGYTFHEACDEIRGEKVEATGTAERRPTVKHEKVIEWRPLTPVAEDFEGVPARHYRYGAPSGRWEYRDAAGSVIGYVCRFDLPDGKKEVWPLTFCTDGSRHEWRWQGFAKPRPLYNLHLLRQHPDKIVILVEGEKTADAVQAQNLEKNIVLTWPGGGKAIENIDWQPLDGRKILLWPDNDQPGDSAMLHVASKLARHAALLKWVQNPAGLPKGWDGADKPWQPGEVRDFLKANLTDLPKPLERLPKFLVPKHGTAVAWRHTPREGEAAHYSVREEHPNGSTDWRYVKEEEQEPEPTGGEPEQPELELPPLPDEFHSLPPVNDEKEPENFRFLGFTNENGGTRHHFFSNQSRTIISLSPTSLTSKANLMQLARLQWWEDTFPSKRGLDMDAASNWLIQTSLRHGFFSEKMIRGRGAWTERDRVVVHAGDRLLIDGEARALGEHKSRYIYEMGEPLGIEPRDPLSNKEANRLMEILRPLNWEREINAYLLAGWCIVAPVCGALNWRPHIWLTGPAGTGKSWLFLNVVRRLLGETSLAVQGETTEAGVRQLLGHDALPVVFDEAEGQDAGAQQRVQSILSLMRAASADDGGIIAKGSAGGTALTFKIRSCFAFASIAVQVVQQSDRGRVTILGLREQQDKVAAKEHFAKVSALYNEIVTDEFVERLQARTLSLLPVILANARTFSTAAAAVIGQQRAGDQLGALLAGAYSLYSGNIITYDKAVEWIQEKDWNEEKGLDQTRDELSLLNHLLEQEVEVEAAGQRYKRTVLELVEIASARVFNTTEIITGEEAHNRMKRLGLKIDGEWLLVSNGSNKAPVWVARVLKDTPWAKNHNKILERLPGARASAKTERFASLPTRAVQIPLAVVFPD